MAIEVQYEIEKLAGEVSIERCKIVRVEVPGKEGKTRPKIIREQVTVPAGYMVYCPMGHSFRVASLEKLRELGLEAQPGMVDMASGVTISPPRLSLKHRAVRR